MVVARLVEVGGDRYREDGFEVRRLLYRRLELRHGEVADADHPDIAVGPGLCGCPLDEVVHVTALFCIEEAERAARPSGAAQIRNDVDVPARYEKIALARFNEAHRRAAVLDLTRIRRRRDQHRISPWRGRSVHVSEKCHAVPHRHGDVVVAGCFVLRLRQVAVVAARGLRAV